PGEFRVHAAGDLSSLLAVDDGSRWTDIHAERRTDVRHRILRAHYRVKALDHGGFPARTRLRRTRRRRDRETPFHSSEQTLVIDDIFRPTQKGVFICECEWEQPRYSSPPSC